MPLQKARRKSLADRIHNRFYAWFGRQHPGSYGVVSDGFTRRSLRDAYEAGWQAARRSLHRVDIRASSDPAET